MPFNGEVQGGRACCTLLVQTFRGVQHATRVCTEACRCLLWVYT